MASCRSGFNPTNDTFSILINYKQVAWIEREQAMLAKESCVLVLSALLLTACAGGGGGGGGSTPSVMIPATAIIGTVTPPVAPVAAALIQSVNPVPPSNILLPPNSLPANFPAIAQRMNYTFDPAGLPSLKVSTLSVDPVDTVAFVSPNINIGAMPGDTTLGQPNGISINTAWGVGLSTNSAATMANDSLGGLPAVVFTLTLPGSIGSEIAGYVLPYSATLNPAGYTYQTFGSWIAIPSANNLWEGYFSTGVPTAVATLPLAGTASYTGVATGSLVDALTRDPAETIATMNASVDFAARTVAFATTGTTSLSNNVTAGTLPTASPGLNMSGTLSYAAGSNTFTGSVSSANGMSGNATGRFYGPGIAAATATKVVGAPPEIGGTFAVKNTSVGAMQGAFGGK